MSAAPEMNQPAVTEAPQAPSSPSPQGEETARVSQTGERSNPHAARDAQRARDAQGRFAAFREQQLANAGVDDDDEPVEAAGEVDPNAEVAEPETPEVEAAPVVEVDDPAKWPEPARVALQQATQEAQRFKAEINEWRGAGQEVHQQNLGLLMRLQFWQKQAEQAGAQIDPRDLQILDYAIEKQNQSFSGDLSKRQQEAQFKAQSDGLVQQYRGEAQRLAAAAKLDPNEVLIRWANEQKAHVALKREGDGPSIGDVVHQMQAVQAAKQQATSKTVPALLGKKPAPGGTVVKFPNTPTGWRDAMKSRGHEVD